MNFIIDNYLWFGIAGVLMLMALIGFLAEKTNFIVGSNDKPKSDKKKKKQHVDNNDNMVEEAVETYDTPLNEEVSSSVLTKQSTSVKDDEVLDFSSLTTTAVEPTIASAPLYATDTQNQVENADISSNEASVITETGEDLSQPFGEPIKASVESVEPAQSTTNTVDEDIWKF